MTNWRQLRQEYLNKFPAKDVDRFTIACPDCKQGCNSRSAGGSPLCFHCDVCGLVECFVTSPVIEEEESDGY